MIARCRPSRPWGVAAAAAILSVFAYMWLTDWQAYGDPSPPVAMGPAPAGISAEQVLAQMRETYAGCGSYEDQGLVTTKFVGLAGHTRRLPFSTSFARPSNFRYEYRDGRQRYVVWADGESVKSWWTLRPAVEEFDGIESALAGPTGVSGGSATAIPPLLMPEMRWGQQLGRLSTVKLEGIDRVDERPCFRVEGEYFPGRAMTVWVDTESHLVRRMFERLSVDPQGARPGKPFTVETTITFEPKLNVQIAAERFGFEPN